MKADEANTTRISPPFLFLFFSLCISFALVISPPIVLHKIFLRLIDLLKSPFKDLLSGIRTLLLLAATLLH